MTIFDKFFTSIAPKDNIQFHIYTNKSNLISVVSNERAT